MTQKDINKQRLKEYLASQEWNYEDMRDNDDVYIAAMGFSVEGRLNSIRLLVQADETTIQSFGVCPINATESSAPQVVEYVTRANYGLKIGKFEFDYSDGEVRFQSSLSSLEGTPNLANIERVVDMPIRMFNRYGDGLVKALMGLGDPKADIAEAEADV